MQNDLLDAGIYAIINKKLKSVYVGETETSFLIRWIEHAAGIPRFVDDEDRMELYLDKHTKYIILKKLNAAENNTKEFYKWEDQAIQFYKDKGWKVVSQTSYSPDAKEHERLNRDEKFIRYRRAINHMIRVLGLINTKNNNIPLLYSKLYKKIDKHFETNVRNRTEKKVMESLTKEELEFMMLDLFPRYQQKILALYRTEFEDQDKQLSLF